MYTTHRIATTSVNTSSNIVLDNAENDVRTQHAEEKEESLGVLDIPRTRPIIPTLHARAERQSHGSKKQREPRRGAERTECLCACPEPSRATYRIDKDRMVTWGSPGMINEDVGCIRTR